MGRWENGLTQVYCSGFQQHRVTVSSFSSAVTSKQLSVVLFFWQFADCGVMLFQQEEEKITVGVALSSSWKNTLFSNCFNFHDVLIDIFFSKKMIFWTKLCNSSFEIILYYKEIRPTEHRPGKHLSEKERKGGIFQRGEKEIEWKERLKKNELSKRC